MTLSTRSSAFSPRAGSPCHFFEPLEPRRLLTAYFVSPTGNDHAAGTKSHPWQTIAKLDQTTFKPGDVIEFNGAKNAVYPGQLNLNANATGVSVTSYNGTATIEGGTENGIVVTTGGVNISNLIVTNPDQLLNDGTGILFQNTTTTAINNETVTNVTVTNFSFSGIGVEAFNASSPAGFHNVTISDCQCDSNGIDGIDVGNWQWSVGALLVAQQLVGDSCSDITIEGCSTNYNTGNNPIFQQTYFDHCCGGGIVVHNVNGCVVDHCIAHDNGKDAAGVPDKTGDVAIWGHDGNNITIEHCEAYNQATTATDGGGFDLDRGTTNSVMEYDYSHDNAPTGYGILLAEVSAPVTGYENADNTIRYCISRDDGIQGGIAVFSVTGNKDPILGAQIYNNTVYSHDGNLGFWMSSADSAADAGGTLDMALRNNIFYMSGGGYAVDADPWAIGNYTTNDGIQFQGNDYYYPSGNFVARWNSADANFATWTGTLDQETYQGKVVGLQVNPALTDADAAPTEIDRAAMNSYRLSPASPLVGAGLDMQDFSVDPGTTDFYGDALDPAAGTDMGASDPPPSPWTVADFGSDYAPAGTFSNVGFFGTAGNQTGTGSWTDTASGTGFSAATDQFSFVSQPMAATGGSLVVDLASLTSADADQINRGAFSGLMIRENSADAGSPFASIGLTPAGDLKWMIRSTESAPVKSATVHPEGHSAWLTLIRSASGTTVSSYFSKNGKSWAFFAKTTMPGLTGNADIGFAADSGDDARQVVTGIEDAQFTTAA